MPYAIGIVAVLIVLGIVFRHSLSWGDVPTWVMAVITLLAFLAAGFAGIVAYDLLTVEIARDHKAAEERLLAAADRKRADDERAAQREADRRAQASNVTAWFAFYSDEYPVETWVWGAAVFNGSGLPILDVRVFFYYVNDPGDGKPWTTELRYIMPENIRIIPPGQTRYRDLPGSIYRPGERVNDQVYMVAIEFTDNKGIRWMRNERGILFDPSKAHELLS